MVNCTSCGRNVTGKKFCPDCGTRVQVALPTVRSCPQCYGEVGVEVAFCMHCGAALASTGQARATTPSAHPVTRTCPTCSTQVDSAMTFCTQCGHDMRNMCVPASLACTSCGRQNEASMHFCGGCGASLHRSVPAAASYGQANPYGAQTPHPPSQGYSQPYPQNSYAQSSPYAQTPYPAQQSYGQAQGGYTPEPMLGQQPMVLRCPTCMAQAQVGATHCTSCRTSLAGIVPTPAYGNQGQRGGFLQGNGGQLAMGALGGAAAVIGGEMLLHGLERRVEDGISGHHHRDEGLLGGIADDLGLF